MLYKLRQRAKDERGFTLIELLVVILIIGILAAIAIPSFLNQKSKATDAGAKSLANTALTTAETIATDNNGSYANVTLANLNSYEATIQTSSSPSGNAYVACIFGPQTGTAVSGFSNSGCTAGSGSGTAAGYTIGVLPASGSQEYFISREANGSEVRFCTTGTGTAGAQVISTSTVAGGCVDGSW